MPQMHRQVLQMQRLRRWRQCRHVLRSMRADAEVRAARAHARAAAKEVSQCMPAGCELQDDDTRTTELSHALNTAEASPTTASQIGQVPLQTAPAAIVGEGSNVSRPEPASHTKALQVGQMPLQVFKEAVQPDGTAAKGSGASSGERKSSVWCSLFWLFGCCGQAPSSTGERQPLVT